MGNQNSSSPEEENKETSDTKQIFIEVFQDEMLSKKSVDGIVCFIDSNWSLNEELYQKVLSRGGNRFISSHSHLKHQHKTPKIGDVFESDAGMLPCKIVLYSVSCYHDDSLHDDQAIHSISSVVVNQLNKASELNLKSIAIPFVQGHPNPHIQELITALYYTFGTVPSTINDLHLITLDADLLQPMKSVLSDFDKSFKSHLKQQRHLTLNEQETRHLETREEQVKSETGDPKTEWQADSSFAQHVEGYRESSNSDINLNQSDLSENELHDCESDKVTARMTDDNDGIISSVTQALDNTSFEARTLNGTRGSLSENHQELDDNDITVTPLHKNTVKGDTHSIPSHVDDASFKYSKNTDKKIDTTVLKTFPDINVDEAFTRSVSSGSEWEEPLDFENVFENVDTVKVVDKDQTGDLCPICLNEIPEHQRKILDKCQHQFCEACLNQHFEKSLMKTCPVCRLAYGTITGNQPDGIMYYRVVDEKSLPGYESYGIIVIEYDIPNGIQEENHPHPGMAFTGARRTAFLPDCQKGNMVLKMLQKAFDRKLVFTVGTSSTTGKENMVTWNDIHHKTRREGGPERYGYPDPGYLDRVIKELSFKGITED